MCVIVPLIVEPFFVTSLDTITSIWLGSDGGGAEVSPGAGLKVAPQVRLGVELSAKPFIAEGALPPLSEFCFAHWLPQKYTACPMVGEPAEMSPITKAPRAVVGGKTSALDDAL